MKRVLILSPSWVPSTLVCIHRLRGLAEYLPRFGWEPVVVCVDKQYYKEPLAPELEKLVRPDLEVQTVAADPAKRGQLQGNVALRGYRQILSKGRELLKARHFDLIFASISPGYAAMQAAELAKEFQIPYVVDYQDPWVQPLPPLRRLLNKRALAILLARLLEPRALKHASAVTGVSSKTVAPVIARYRSLAQVPTAAIPIGFDPREMEIEPEDRSPAWAENERVLLFAGSIPESFFPFWRVLFGVVQKMRQENALPQGFRFHFIGTNHAMKPLAEAYGIGELVTEQSERVSYLRILYLVRRAWGLPAIGSMEAHFTASKIFQLLYAKRPIFAVYHQESSVNQILAQAGADRYLVRFDPARPEAEFHRALEERFHAYLADLEHHSTEWTLKLEELAPYTVEAATENFAKIFNKVTEA